MFNRLFPILLLLLDVISGKIVIRDANVAALSRDDIGMIFYITIQNGDVCGYAIKVSMIECTEQIDAKDRDSGFMNLIGGHMGFLRPKCYKNITVLYPNMYLHNRRGYCLISLKFKSEKDTITQKKANITFNTYLTKRSTPPILRGYYIKSEVRTCKSVDMDPLNKCRPVDCHMKYLGTRNYFNRQWSRCQKVPICIADSSKSMPDVIYTPSNNKCRDMERPISKNDLQSLEASAVKGPCSPKYGTLKNVNCHFGKLNNETGECECFDGWESSPVNKDTVDTASLFVYHMCNIEIAGWYDTSSRKLKVAALIIGILAVVICMIIIICSFLIQQCYNCIKSFEDKDASEKKNKDKKPRKKILKKKKDDKPAKEKGEKKKLKDKLKTKKKPAKTTKV